MKTLKTLTIGILFTLTLATITKANGQEENQNCCQLKSRTICLSQLDVELEEAINDVKEEWNNHENSSFLKVIHINSSKTNGYMKLVIESEEQYQSDEVQSLLRRAQVITESEFEASYILD